MMFLHGKPCIRKFRNYLAGLLGESERKNRSQMSDNAIKVVYYKLHHFLTASLRESWENKWSSLTGNESVSSNKKCFWVYLNSGWFRQRKSGTLTSGVGRQYKARNWENREWHSHCHDTSWWWSEKLTPRRRTVSTRNFALLKVNSLQNLRTSRTWL